MESKARRGEKYKHLKEGSELRLRTFDVRVMRVRMRTQSVTEASFAGQLALC